MHHLDFIVENLGQLADIARKLAEQVKVGDVICLEGEMGVGKTTFAKDLICAILRANDDTTEIAENHISSPTFNIVHTYGPADKHIWHFDLYRISNVEELAELGLEQALQTGITIVEWPHIAYSVLPSEMIVVRLEFSGQPEQRRITVLHK